MKTMTPREILDLPMRENDSGQATVRGYLVALLAMLWDEGDDFSGKRPFGNSNWDSDLHDALADAELVRFDDRGSVEVSDIETANRLIGGAILALGEPGAEASRPLEVDVRAMAVDLAIRIRPPFSKDDGVILSNTLANAREIETYLLGTVAADPLRPSGGPT